MDTRVGSIRLCSSRYTLGDICVRVCSPNEAAVASILVTYLAAAHLWHRLGEVRVVIASGQITCPLAS